MTDETRIRCVGGPMDGQIHYHQSDAPPDVLTFTFTDGGHGYRARRTQVEGAPLIYDYVGRAPKDGAR